MPHHVGLSPRSAAAGWYPTRTNDQLGVPAGARNWRVAWPRRCPIVSFQPRHQVCWKTAGEVTSITGPELGRLTTATVAMSGVAAPGED